MNDIQVTIENTPSNVNPDDDWDPMRDEYEDVTKNSYDCGPGADLDVTLQRPRYRFVIENFDLILNLFKI